MRFEKIAYFLYGNLYTRFKLKKQYILCNRGIGDTIIFLSKLKEIKQRNPEMPINLIIQENHTILIDSYKQYIDEYVVLGRKKMNGLMSMASRGFLPPNIQFILPEGAYTFLGYNGISIQDLINVTFGLSSKTIGYERPHFKWAEDSRKKLLNEYQLEKDKFVILGVDAVSVNGVEIDKWQCIAEKFSKLGYKVVTNLTFSGQSPIPGTIGLFLPLNEIYLLAEYGGFFVGLRSGLCDLLAFSDCRMTVIYPTEEDRYKYSFKNMYFEKEIEEIMACDVEEWTS
jgi:hypothetical protein